MFSIVWGHTQGVVFVLYVSLAFLFDQDSRFRDASASRDRGTYMAHVVMEYLVGLQHEVCTGPGFAATAAAPVPLHKFTELVQEKQRCWLNQNHHLISPPDLPFLNVCKKCKI